MTHNPIINYKIKLSLICTAPIAIASYMSGSTTAIVGATILNLFIPCLILLNFYVTIRKKFILSTVFALMWAIFSYNLAYGWILEFSEIVGLWISVLAIFGIAIIPGFMSAFMISSLFLDLRPTRRKDIDVYPPITLLIAAYNESDNILSTLESIGKQNYGGHMSVIAINDGSTDDTLDKIYSVKHLYPWLTVLDLGTNRGKSIALNEGLKIVKTNLTITIDADSYLYKNALQNIVSRYLNDPQNTAAVAGAVLVRNSRKNLVTKTQEWDYFHGIASVKRIQSLYQGTLVAQGAFSVYETTVLRKLGGWPKCVGEDIVLTWSILKAGYRVGYAEDACVFTNVPDTWRQFIRQRQRWSRGLIEAFKENWQLLFKPRMSTMFIWWNLLFPYLDLAYTFVFIPGIILALAGVYWIAGAMTLLVLPLGMIVNYTMYSIQSEMFRSQGLRVRRNIVGFIFYSLFYSLVLQPACVIGYLMELIHGGKKSWGTK